MATRLYSHLLGSPEDHVMSLNTIVTREPMMQYVIDILNNLCLQKGVRISIAFSKPEKGFNDFFEQYFVSTLPNVLRYKLYCGFLPWVVHKHPVTGDRIPVLLPIGSFAWHVRTKEVFVDRDKQKGMKSGSYNKKRNRDAFGGDTEDGCNINLEHNYASEYVVQTCGDLGVRSGEINVINLIDPMLVNGNVGTMSGSQNLNGGNSLLGQAQYSPLYVALQKYLALDLAQQRRCYADDWNTTARLFTTKTPPAVQNERAGRDEIPYGTTRFQQAQMPEGFFTYDNMKIQYQTTSDIIRDALEQTGGRGSEHVPSVYSLPAHYNLVQQPELKPLMDIELLENQYRSSIAQSLGVPLSVLECNSSKATSSNVGDLPFTSQMVKNTCDNLIGLMSKVLLHMYSVIYHEKSAKVYGPRPVSTVRFQFAADELYSEQMKQREDDQVKLQKSATNVGSSSKK
jgi:hypothetical protein